MQTTQLYVELIIIGLEGSVGLILTFITLFGFEKFNQIASYFNTTPSAIFIIGFLYIFGLLLDRLADLIFQKWEDEFRKQSGLQAKSVMVLLTNKNHINFLEFTRTRARILRASILITLFSTIMALICFVVQPIDNSLNALIFCLSLGGFSFFTSFFSYRKMMRKYYSKARIIELDKNPNTL